MSYRFLEVPLSVIYIWAVKTMVLPPKENGTDITEVKT